MQELEQFSRLLQALYDAALDDARWQPLVGQIAVAFGVHSCTVQVRGNDGSMTLLGMTPNVEPKALQEYLQHYYKVDLWAHAGRDLASTAAAGRAMTGDQLVSPNVLRRSEISEFQRETDALSLLGSGVELTDGTAGLIGIHGGAGTAPFDDAARRKLNLLLPHLQRALQMRTMFLQQKVQRDMALGALDKLTSPILLADAGGRLVYANHAANTLLGMSSSLTVQHGRIQAESPKLTEALLHQIHQACQCRSQAPNSFPCATVILPRLDQAPLSVMVAPARAGDLSAVQVLPMAMLVVQTGENRLPPPALLEALFKLSPAEAKLACGLAQGLDLEALAAQRGVSLNTVRTQLKSALHKTNTRRQGELVALVFKYAAGAVLE